MPLAAIDQIFSALVEDGSKGVAKEEFYRVRAAVGLAREVAADAKRREEREEREKEQAKAKEALQARIDAAKAVVDSAEEAVKKVEEQTAPSQTEKVAALSMVDMAAAVE